MRSVFILVLFTLGGNLMANDFINFSGRWVGECEFNGNIKPSTKTIEQVKKDKIIINGQSFNLDKPTSTDITDTYNGDKYREVTVYDFKWNKEQTEIATTAKWIGWYLDKSGSWHGNGEGVIKLQGDELITTREFESSFSSGKEFCRYRITSNP